jgi:hypothetical protein
MTPEVPRIPAYALPSLEARVFLAVAKRPRPAKLSALPRRAP